MADSSGGTDQMPAEDPHGRPPPLPGIVVVHSRSGPCWQPCLVPVGSAITLGRDAPSDLVVEDSWLSQQHVRFEFDSFGWNVTDLGSTNGTWVDGERLVPGASARPKCLVRAAGTLVLVSSDLPLLSPRPVVEDKYVVGPSTARALRDTAHAAANRRGLLIEGESGTGKELLARHYHAAGPHASGPWVAINCATLPPDFAVTELFGAEKGSHSTAMQRTAGAFEQAHRGVLFLDEVHTLRPSVHQVLLRALQQHEIRPLGATFPRPVDVLVVAATNRDLRAAYKRGDFPEDLYARLAERFVRLPPMRERLEEVPLLLELKRLEWTAPPPGVAIVEWLMLATFRGDLGLNIRGILSAFEPAATVARDEGASQIKLAHLPPHLFLDTAISYVSEPPPPPMPAPSTAPPTVPIPDRPAAAVDQAGVDEGIERTIAGWPQEKRDVSRRLLAELRDNEWDVPAACEVTGIGRTRAYKLLGELGIHARRGPRSTA